MCDPDEWPPDPPSWDAWHTAEDSGRVVSDRTGFIEDLQLTKAQTEAEVKRRKRAARRPFGFGV